MTGSGEVSAFRFRLREEPLQGDWAFQTVSGPDAGCVVLFRGLVRDRTRGREVRRLEYQAYAGMVGAELARIHAEIAARHPILRVAVEHACGPVPVGGCSVAVAVAAEHRAPAFAAAAAFLDELKRRVPIWKKEFYADGSSWIGRGS